jgi:hypothetical protein
MRTSSLSDFWPPDPGLSIENGSPPPLDLFGVMPDSEAKESRDLILHDLIFAMRVP